MGRYALWHVVLVSLFGCVLDDVRSARLSATIGIHSVFHTSFSYLSIHLYLYDVLMILFRFPCMQDQLHQ